MLLSFLSLVGLAAACADNHLHTRDGPPGDAQAHVHEKRENSQLPLTTTYRQAPALTLPYRPLVWGDFNVIHTTDTHGWLLGHQKSSWPEPNYR